MTRQYTGIDIMNGLIPASFWPMDSQKRSSDLAQLLCKSRQAVNKLPPLIQGKVQALHGEMCVIRAVAGKNLGH